jgi:hypothetical protein
MSAARAAVYAYKINGWGDEMEIADLNAALREKDGSLAVISRAIPWQYIGGGIPAGMTTLAVLAGTYANSKATLDLIQIVAARDEVDETVLGEQIAQAMAPAVAAVVTPVIEALLQEGGATHLTADQIREAAAMAVREVLLQGVAE